MRLIVKEHGWIDTDTLEAGFGDRSVRLNPELVKEKDMQKRPYALKGLLISHVDRLELFSKARAAADANDVTTLRQLGDDFNTLEFRQQTLWGFPEDQNFHRHFDVPGCTCDKEANERRYGRPHPIIHQECPVHGHWAAAEQIPGSQSQARLPE